VTEQRSEHCFDLKTLNNVKLNKRINHIKTNQRKNENSGK